MTTDNDLFIPQGTIRQQDVIRAALARCDFPWGWLRVGLHADTGRERIPVEWADLSRYADTAPAATQLHDHEGARAHGGSHDVRDPVTGEKAHVLAARDRVLGLAWYSGKVTIDTRLVADPVLAGEVFLSEAAHMVDFFWLADRHRIAVWNALHPASEQLDPDTAVADGQDLGHGHSWFDVGPYGSWVGEALMGAFVAAFSDFPVTMLFPDHPVTPRAAKAVRAALLGAPPPAEFVGARRSRVYHHPDCWIVPAIIRPLPLGHVAPPDRRPCRLCKPDQPRGLRRGPEEL